MNLATALLDLGAARDHLPEEALHWLRDNWDVAGPAASLVLARCQTPESGRHHWKVRFDTSLAPDITVAVRLDQPNQAALDYYLLPRLDFGQPLINLAERNPIEFESYRFDSLDYLYGMAERTRVRRAA